MGDGQGFQRVGTILIQARASEASLSISRVRRGSWETQMQRTWEPVCPRPYMSPKDLTWSTVTKGASEVALVVKNPPAMWEPWVQSLCQENSLEEEMATDSSILAWRTPWTEKPGRLQSMGPQRIGHD